MDAIIDDEAMARTIVHGPGYLVHKYSGPVNSREYLVVHLLDETILSRNDESEKKLNLQGFVEKLRHVFSISQPCMRAAIRRDFLFQSSQGVLYWPKQTINRTSHQNAGLCW